MNAQAKYLTKKGVEQALLLVKRGEPVEVASNYHKYLFSTFYNPELEEEKPDTYYIYWDDFFEKLLVSILCLLFFKLDLCSHWQDQ